MSGSAITRGVWNSRASNAKKTIEKFGKTYRDYKRKYPRHLGANIDQRCSGLNGIQQGKHALGVRRNESSYCFLPHHDSEPLLALWHCHAKTTCFMRVSSLQGLLDILTR